MVSLRRRRLLGLCSGVKDSFVAPLPLFDDGIPPEHNLCSTNSVSKQPTPVDDVKLSQDLNYPLGRIGSSNDSGSSQSNVQNNQSNVSASTSSQEPNNQPCADREVKRRKQHRRKRIHSQERCVMRGVYLKNMKWQAAIKVDKKQIHLGTVNTQAEAARLYDRAAFMCGRETNFELPEEEKKELRKIIWDEFLAITRHALSSKRHRRQQGTGTPPPSAQRSDWDGEQGTAGLSPSKYGEPEAADL